MVSVWRAVVEPSCFLVVVADSGESIEKSSVAAERLPRFRYHCTPKGAPPETGRRGLQSAPRQRVDWGMGARRELQIFLLTTVVITSIIVSQPQEVGHDEDPQERRTRARVPRLAGFAFHVFVCRLFRSRTRAVPHAAGDERRPNHRGRWFSEAPSPGYGNRDVRAGRRTGAQGQHGQRVGYQAG